MVPVTVTSPEIELAEARIPVTRAKLTMSTSPEIELAFGVTNPMRSETACETPSPAASAKQQRKNNHEGKKRRNSGQHDAVMRGALEGDAVETGEGVKEQAGLEAEEPFEVDKVPDLSAAVRSLVLLGVKLNITLSFTPVRGAPFDALRCARTRSASLFFCTLQLRVQDL